MKELNNKYQTTYNLVIKQLESFFGIDDNDKVVLKQGVEIALESCAYCFSKINDKYFVDKKGDILFNTFHSGQYTIFLYYLSRMMYTKSLADRSLLDKIYYLNRLLNSVDLFYEVDLPEVFYVDHPLGSVIGRATIAKNFSFRQLCTVGNNKGIYPVLSENVMMLNGSTILGKCLIGSYTIFGAHSFVKDLDVPDNSMVVGRYPNHRILPLSKEVRDEYFDIFNRSNVNL